MAGPLNTTQIAFEWRRIRRLPAPELARRAALKLLGWTVWLLLLPVSVALHLRGYRRPTFFVDRIGHLALEPDCLVKEERMGSIPARKWLLPVARGSAANEHLLGYWDGALRIVRAEPWRFFLDSMSRCGPLRFDVRHYARAIGVTQAAYRVQRTWGERPPVLALSAEDRLWRERSLKGLGLPDDAWYVCVHVREAGFAPADDELHQHRNADIAHLVPALCEIVRRGGWVVRLGHSGMKPLPPLPQVVDYAHHALRSPRLDVALCAGARFVLGDTSGIALVATVFGVPCALANMVPVSAMGFGPRDLAIPKHHWSLRENRRLRFTELLGSPLATAQYASLYAEAGVRLEENSPEEILDLAAEMLDRLDGVAPPPDDLERQARAQARLRPGHYAFGGAARMGASFMKRHPDFFDE